jgi:hypothetical protein
MKTTKTSLLLIAMSALSAIAAVTGTCPTPVAGGPCAPAGGGPYPPGCIKQTCSSGTTTSQSCGAPYTSTKPCNPGSGTWSCSYQQYPPIYQTNWTEGCENCKGATWTDPDDGTCYCQHIALTGCDGRFPSPYQCDNSGSYPCNGTCEYDTAGLSDSTNCVAAEN